MDLARDEEEASRDNTGEGGGNPRRCSPGDGGSDVEPKRSNELSEWNIVVGELSWQGLVRYLAVAGAGRLATRAGLVTVVAVSPAIVPPEKDLLAGRGGGQGDKGRGSSEIHVACGLGGMGDPLEGWFGEMAALSLRNQLPLWPVF